MANSHHHLAYKPDTATELNILLVDDDEIDRANILRMLSDSTHVHYNITTAKNFSSALTALSKDSFDLCLLDYHLGSRTGIELIEEVQKYNSSSSSILLTEATSATLDDEALRAGFCDHLNKAEISKPQLERAIRYGVHHKQILLEKERFANYDPLTKLANRHLFLDRLSRLTSRSSRHNRQYAVLYIDLDHFKSINDEHGHCVGDRLLVLFAERLLSGIRCIDTAARLGGDEFSVILEEISPENAKAVAAKLTSEMAKPFTVNNIILKVSASIGITVFPSENNAKDPTIVLRQADQALYHAKESGRNQYCVFDKKLNHVYEERTIVEQDLGPALHTESFYPVYQPQYHLDDAKIIGFEALARWIHPTKGPISPATFIAYAEKTTLISSVTEAILQKSWLDTQAIMNTNPDLKMSVNVSANELASPRLLANIRRLDALNQINIKQLEIEVTESVLISEPKAVIKTLHQLHQMGIRIAIDDFGTGYSSLSYLTELPLDVLKIDLRFVQGIGTSSQKEAVIKLIIDLAARLNLDVIAEGVETQEQIDFLQHSGCHCIQGYFCSKPRPFEEILPLFKSKDPLH